MPHHGDSPLLAFLREPCKVIWRVGDEGPESNPLAKVSGYRYIFGIALLVVNNRESGNKILEPRGFTAILVFPYIEKGDLFHKVRVLFSDLC